MANVSYETTIDAPLDAVWAFHEDVANALPALSPPRDEVKLESIDGQPRIGFTVVIAAKGPLGRLRWAARYVEYEPPHDVIFGREARFVDVQDTGPFKSFRHSHEFEAIDHQTTRVVDRIDYQVGYGPIGWIANTIFVRRKLDAIFAHRHARLHKLLNR